MRQKTLLAALAGFASLLPGDVVHDVAPISKPSRPNDRDAMELQTAAQLKRLRKAAKRRHA